MLQRFSIEYERRDGLKTLLKIPLCIKIPELILLESLSSMFIIIHIIWTLDNEYYTLALWIINITH